MSNPTLEITPKAAPSLLMDAILAGLVPMLHGSPGIGKSDIAHGVAATLNLKLIDIRLGQCDPTDLNGFPAKSADGKNSTYLPMDTFPLEGADIPTGFDGWLIMYDELPGASKAVQDAAYKILLDRMVGQHKLHSKVYQMAAGNLSTDKAIVNKMSTALQSRMCHLKLKVSPTDWFEWAISNNLDHRVISFLQFKPEELYNFDPDHKQFTFPCPRTWEFTSKLVKNWPQITYDKLPLVAGTISEGSAREFFTYCEIYKSLVTLEEILANPQGTPVPSEPSTLWAITGSIASRVTAEQLDKAMDYINRLPMEFRVNTMQQIIKRNPASMKHPKIMQWIATDGRALFS